MERFTRRFCVTHGDTEFVLESSGYYRCKLCRQQRVKDWRRRAKQLLIAEAGGSCQLCGYDRCPGALHFHHVDPASKKFGISRKGFTRSIAKMREEAAKCVVLCSDCHAEVEAGVASITKPVRGGAMAARRIVNP